MLLYRLSFVGINADPKYLSSFSTCISSIFFSGSSSRNLTNILSPLSYVEGNTLVLLSLPSSNKILPGQYVLPEILISRISPDGELRIAGQADLVIVDGNEFSVLDFKTSKEIKKNGFFDQKKKKKAKMHYPLNNLDDTNYWHYTLQLSLYAWIIEKNNPEMKCKGLFLLHHDHKDKKTTYKLDYLKDDVQRMLIHYRKQIEYEK